MLKGLITYGSIAISLGVATNVCFSLYYNRDFRYFSKLIVTSSNWEKSLRETHPHVYVVAGGSSARAGIDPQLLLDEYNLPLINGALGAGYGFDGVVALASQQHLKSQDTLILAIEPGIVIGDDKEMLTPMGSRMLLKEQGLTLHKNPMLDQEWSIYAKAIKGDSFAIASHLAKTLTRPAGQRYSYDAHTQIHPSGWMEVTRRSNYHLPDALLPGTQTLTRYNISDIAETSYLRMKNYCDSQGIKLIALFPRIYAEDSYRAYVLWFMLQLTRLGIPVLYDSNVGVVTDYKLLADTVNHMNAEGTRLNTLEIGKNLKEQRFWTECELIEQLKLRGWDSEGRRIPEPVSK